MSWSPISLSVPQYEDSNGDPYSGAVLKAYAAGTSTPISMATDSTGGTTAGSVALNASGYPAVSGNVIIPHVSANYKLALYPTQAAADANSGALWSVDNLTPLGTLATQSAAAVAITGGTSVMARMAISGLTYANNAGDATNDIDIAAGGAMDATGAYWITLAALTKRSDAAWAVGTNQGGLDTGAVGNSDYYIWAIARSDTGVTDVLFSLSSTAPTMPTNYDYKRLIGWFKRLAGAIVAFHTYETDGGGLEMKWDAPRADVAINNTLTTSRRTDALSVPLNFSVTAIIRAYLYDGAAAAHAVICCPDETDAAPSATASPGVSISSDTTAVGSREMQVRTSAAGLVASRGTVATVDNFAIITTGFRWARRN